MDALPIFHRLPPDDQGWRLVWRAKVSLLNLEGGYARGWRLTRMAGSKSLTGLMFPAGPVSEKLGITFAVIRMFACFLP